LDLISQFHPNGVSTSLRYFYAQNSLNKSEKDVTSAVIILLFFNFWFIISFKVVHNYSLHVCALINPHWQLGIVAALGPRRNPLSLAVLPLSIGWQALRWRTSANSNTTQRTLT